MSAVSLYLGGEAVDISSEDAGIKLTYQLTDLTAPTAVLNSFSKTVSLKGTPTNNSIMRHCWRVDATGFDAQSRVDMALYQGSDLLAKGYAKLDSISRSASGEYTYSLTLYGGLGAMLYNLKYLADGKSKRTLADLIWSADRPLGMDLSFKVNATNVKAAWDALAAGTTTGKWSYINFAPMYNGVPSALDAGKVLMEYDHNLLLGGFKKTTEDGAKTLVDGYLMAEAPEDLTEWATRDLRSYLQRPVVKLSRVIEACCNPWNNGGWEVELDPTFFCDNNPYYAKAWMTLPMLSKGDGEATTVQATDLTLTQSGDHLWTAGWTGGGVGKDGATLNVRLAVTADGTTSQLYTTRRLTSSNAQAGAVTDYSATCGICLQLLAYNGSKLVSSSPLVYLQSTVPDGGMAGGSAAMAATFANLSPAVDITSTVEYIGGSFVYNTGGSRHLWTTSAGATSIPLTLQTSAVYDKLVLKAAVISSERVTQNVTGTQTRKAIEQSAPLLWPSTTAVTSAFKTWATARETGLASDTGLRPDPVSLALTESADSEFISGTTIQPSQLFPSDLTPADLLLSYCKTFGLMIVQDLTAESRQASSTGGDGWDILRYDYAGTLRIVQRGTFYDRSTVVDLTDIADLSRAASLTPRTAESRYYTFAPEAIGQTAEDWQDANGDATYGGQTLDTGYQFDNAETSALDTSLKAAAEAYILSKWHVPNKDGVPYWCWRALKYSLYSETGDGEYESEELTHDTAVVKAKSINGDGIVQGSLFPLVGMSSGGSATDGCCLVFYKGHTPVEQTYELTDDLALMATLNDGKPCWLWTMSDGIAVTVIPVFGRNIYGEDAEGNKTIAHTLEMGQMDGVETGAKIFEDGATVYDAYHADYYGDLYSRDGRVLTLYVRVKGAFDPQTWLSRFYWWRGAMWRLNKVSEWSPTSEKPVKMELIKVQDISNYKSIDWSE